MTPGAVRFRRHSMAAHQSWYRERVTAHGLKQRLARWLLMMRDRSDEDELPIIQNRQNAGVQANRHVYCSEIRA
jgi:hypothetical protein